MEVVDIWTGRHANALRIALRLTNESMAGKLGTAVRTVAKWNAEPDLVPVTELQRALDTALAQATADERRRFDLLLGAATNSPAQSRRSLGSDEQANPFEAAAELRLQHDPVVHEVLEWLEDAAGWSSGEAEARVHRYLNEFDFRSMRNRSRMRARVQRSDLARSLSDFYGLPSGELRAFSAEVDDRQVSTSVLTRADWTGLRMTLGQGEDQLTLADQGRPELEELAPDAAEAAARRISEILATDTRLVETPLYRLDHIDVGTGRLSGSLSMTTFTRYALTLDLLERETLDAVSAGTPEAQPLRRHYLPDLDAVTGLDRRLCAGGPLALFAAARPGSRFRRNEPDYVLLIQQRSGKVLNAANRLAVIPKGFHEPLVDFSDDAQLSATLEREMEEELFGRADVDSTEGERRQADPFHLSRLSEPMRWLIDHNTPDQWRMECTGFGLNLVSGNYEFASLIVIDNEEWWERFGGHVEANWESDGLRRYSTQDQAGLARLVHDDTWSNEGLFALLLGLQRLAEIGGARVKLPRMKVGI
jgi:hypothetical protein